MYWKARCSCDVGEVVDNDKKISVRPTSYLEVTVETWGRGGDVEHGNGEGGLVGMMVVNLCALAV